MDERPEIRSRVALGATGDRARVHRILKVENRLYVEVEQTRDAKEKTIMVAVNDALQKYEDSHHGGSSSKEN